jgi:hypothetical protein
MDEAPPWGAGWRGRRRRRRRHSAAAPGHPGQGLGDGIDVERWAPAGAVEQRGPPKLGDHRASARLAHGRRGQDHVVQDLDGDAAETHHDHGTEVRIAADAQDHLGLAADHLLHQKALEHGRGRGAT